MTHQTHDKAGRPYAKLSEIKAGDIIELDGDFDCHEAGIVNVHIYNGEIYFECKIGRHYLNAQADDGEHCVGIHGPLKDSCLSGCHPQTLRHTRC